jgi:Ca2+-binding EF-hand superfamily protein
MEDSEESEAALEEGVEQDDEEGEDYYDEEEVSRLPDIAMAYESMTSSSRRMKHAMESQRLEHAVEKEAERLALKSTHAPQAVDNLRAILKHRYRTLTAGWRLAIDRNSCHHVEAAEFFQALRKLGVPDDYKAVWAELAGHKSHVNLADIDSTATRLLSDFFKGCQEKISRDVKDLVVDTDSLRIDKEGFLKRCTKLERVLSGDRPLNLNAVFRLLRLEAPFVTFADLEWLEQYCTRGQKAEPVQTEEELEQEKAKQEQKKEADRKKVVHDFRELLQHKYGGVIPAWRRVIDPEDKGRVSADDLQTACLKVGFISDPEKIEEKKKLDHLWYELAGAKGFDAKLEKLEPAAIRALEGFNKGCIARFGSMANAFKELHAKNKPLVTKDEFIAWCKEVRTEHGSDKLLWQYLDDRNVGKILMDALDREATAAACSPEVIDKANDDWQAMEPLSARPDHKTLFDRETEKNKANKKPPEELRNHREEFLKELHTKFGSTVRAWRKGIDPQGKGKLTKDEFKVGCASVGYTGNCNSIWKEMGLRAKSNARLKDLDPSTGEDIRCFREKCIDTYASVHDSLGKVSSTKSKVNPRVTKEEFKTLHKQLELEGDPEKLFNHLDAQGLGVVSAKSLKWLKDIPDTEEKALARNLSLQVQMRKKQAAERRGKNATPNAAAAIAEQQAKSKDAADNKLSKKGVIESRARLLKMLAHEYHSVGKGWQVVFDPERVGDLTMDDFLTGLERLSFLKQNATDTELSQAEALFHFMKSEETGSVNLASFDRGLTEKATDELQFHLMCRYGSVQRAFEENDPDGTGEISIADFTRMCQESKFTSAVHRLITYLDPEKNGKIDLRLLEETDADAARDGVLLDKEIRDRRMKAWQKKRPNYCRETPNVNVICGVEARDKDREVRDGVRALKAFKSACNRKYGSLQNAWFKFLNPDGEEETIGSEVFQEAFEALDIDGEPELAWEALNLKSGELSLKEFDASVEKDIVEFHARIKERYGSVDALIDATVDWTVDEKDRSFEVDYETFASFCYECQYRRNERRLFQYYGGDYGTKGSKIDLGKIDSAALERAKEKRKKDEEDDQALKEATQKRLEIQSRRKRGLPDEKTEEEIAEEEMAQAQEEAKNKAAEMKQKRKLKNSKSMDTDTSSVKSESEKKPEARGPEPLALRAGEDPAKLFRGMLVRRFGTIPRAWRVLDCQKQAALTKAEFSKALRVSGYGGSDSVLWTALGCDKLVALKDIDPEVWQYLSCFRMKCQYRLKGLKKAFQGKDGDSVRMDFAAFSKICEKVRQPRPWDVLFDLLDVHCVGSLTYEEVKFLDEDYKWKKEVAVPVRRDPTPLGGSRNMDQAMRTSGVGHLATGMKPRKVFLPKTNSLPDINHQLRPNWNERHHMFETSATKTDNAIHLMKYVKVEDEIRIARRVRTKLIEVPTEQWLRENMPSRDIEDDEDEWGTT